MANFKFCVRCTQPAELLCSRCLDSYCSIECQKADWHLHRQICFKMPTLIHSLNVLELKPPSNIGLQATATIDLKKSPFSPKVSSTQKLTAPNGNIKNAPTPAKQPAPIVSKEIVEEKPKEVKITKSKEQAPVNKVEELKVAKRPEPKVDPIPKVEDLPASQVESIKNPYLKFTTVKRPHPQAQLFNVAQEAPKAPEPQKRTMMKELPVRVWPTTKNVKVKLLNMLDATTLTLRVDNADVDSLYDHIGSSIAKHCEGKARVKYNPARGEVVYALFQDDWYRAHVVDPDLNGCIVQYIDYGNMESVATCDMMPAGPEVKFDVCACDFVIDNLSEEMTEKQHEILSSGSFAITNVRKADDGQMHCQIFGF